MAEKIIPFHQNRRGGQFKPPMNELERFVVEEIHHGRREDHTQKKFVPEAMNRSLPVTSRWKANAPKLQRKTNGRIRSRSPSTLQLNRGNIKRKPSARGRTR